LRKNETKSNNGHTEIVPKEEFDQSDWRWNQVIPSVVRHQIYRSIQHAKPKSTTTEENNQDQQPE
jgi:hypothetical protein